MNWLKKVHSAASLLRIGWMRRSAGVIAILAAVLAIASLTAAGPASAASRGFSISNHTRHAFVLKDVFKPLLWPWNWPMAFEGRPDVGTVLEPGKTQRFEVTWWGHSAIAEYKINDEWDVYFWMGTDTFNVVSGCGFAKAGDKPPYLDPAGLLWNPGLLADHANIDKFNCQVNRRDWQDLRINSRG